MLFKEAVVTPAEIAFGILDEATYLTQEEAALNPVTIPVVSLDEGSNLVEYTYLKQMMLESGIDLQQAREAIAEVNGIDSSSIVTIIPDYEILVDPSLREEVGAYVLTPIPSTSLAYTFCEDLVSLYEETGDETYLQALLEEEDYIELIRHIAMDRTMTSAEKAAAQESIRRKAKLEEERRKQKEQQPPPKSTIGQGMKNAISVTQAKMDAARRNPPPSGRSGISRRKITGVIIGSTAGAAAGLGVNAVLNRIKRIRAEAANQPRSWIGKKISALRSLYSNYLQRAQMARETGQAGVFKTIAAKILGVIDALMAKMQKATG